jgi:ribonuclease J
MKFRIHRGAREVGGTCIEVAASDRRIVLDVGRPLTSLPGEFVAPPRIAGLQDHVPSLLGLILCMAPPSTALRDASAG